MGATFTEAAQALDEAVAAIFDGDPRVRSVGVGRHGIGFGFHAVRNAAQILPLSAGVAPPASVGKVPIVYHDRLADVESLVKVPLAGVASIVPEQQRHRPLVCGLQIENLDDDTRTGVIAGGHIIIGTLGCFVTPPGGGAAALSNNHVVAGENRGVKGTDRIMQQGTGLFSAVDHAATLTDFVVIQASPAGATPKAGSVVFNDVDAGFATLTAGVAHKQTYLSARHVAAPIKTGTVAPDDHVYKVGRTTGLTRGKVTSVTTVVGPVPYAGKPCWFRRSITIEGLEGTHFSDHGDSGSAIIKEGTGELVGLLYAGNGTDTYACPIDLVLKGLNCTF